MNIKSLEDKIQKLGGIESTSPQASKNSTPIRSELKLQNYLDFANKYGSFTFKKSIVVKAVDSIPVANNNEVAVEDFYDYESSNFLCDNYKGQLKAGIRPIFTSEPGDLICINESNARIYYWYHEGKIDNDLFLIADSFEEFMMKLRVDDEDEDLDTYKVKEVKMSQEFLDLLKKSGYGYKGNLPKKND